jgi:uncharacterized protein
VTEGRQDVGFDQISRTISLFPLAGALLLPRGQMPLNIFEPRYLEMIRESVNDTHLIGMIQPQDPTSMELEPEIYRTGCVGRVDAFKETQDGRLLITLTGLCRFHVVEELPMAQPYRRAVVSYSRFRRDMDASDGSGFDRQSLFGALRSYLDLKDMDTDWDSLEKISDESLVSSLAMMCPFEPSEKQALLEADDLAKRAEILTMLMNFAESPFVGDEPPSIQ